MPRAKASGRSDSLGPAPYLNARLERRHGSCPPAWAAPKPFCGILARSVCASRTLRRIHRILPRKSRIRRPTTRCPVTGGPRPAGRCRRSRCPAECTEPSPAHPFPAGTTLHNGRTPARTDRRRQCRTAFADGNSFREDGRLLRRPLREVIAGPCETRDLSLFAAQGKERRTLRVVALRDFVTAPVLGRIPLAIDRENRRIGAAARMLVPCRAAREPALRRIVCSEDPAGAGRQNSKPGKQCDEP